LSRIAVLVSGNGSNLQALLDSEARDYISLVVSNKAEAYALERARRSGCPSQVLLRSQFESRADFDAHLAELLNEQKIDLVVLAGWMHILGPSYLDNFGGNTINLHPALPGQYPGVDAIKRVYEDGVSKTGCMVHRVTLEVDVGEVLGTREVVRLPEDSLADLETRMHEAEHELLVETVERMVGR
jgi:formyltetrahydrofolate-dependent phosphoribosylglycinamide formyltransferase